MASFGEAFKAARKKFENSGSAGDFVFTWKGNKYNVLKKGESKKGAMKKFSASKTSLRPKLRPKAVPAQEAPKKKDAISDEQRKRQATTPKKALNNSAMSPAQQIEKLQKDIAKAKKDRAAKRDAIKQGQAEANKVLADTTPQKRPDSGVFKSLNKDLNAQRKASQTPKARADNRDFSDRQFDIYLGGMDKNKNKDNPRSKTRFPEGNVSSSRSGAKQGMIRAGDEENALDALAVRRAREKLMGLNKGGMTKKSGYKYGGLATTNKPKAAGKVGKKPMVMKDGKKIPAYAADGIGKMNMGGMAKKKTGYMYGGMATTKKPTTKMMGGGMTKKKTMTYNMGGMVKSQVNNLKGKK